MQAARSKDRRPSGSGFAVRFAQFSGQGLTRRRGLCLESPFARIVRVLPVVKVLHERDALTGPAGQLD